MATRALLPKNDLMAASVAMRRRLELDFAAKTPGERATASMRLTMRIAPRASNSFSVTIV